MLTVPSSALPVIRQVPLRRVVGVCKLGPDGLNGEWQRAAPQPGVDKRRGNTYDGELFTDTQAIDAYLSAAGEEPWVVPGRLFSLYA